MITARISSINLDCAEPVVLARFWSEMLAGKVAMETPDFCAVQTEQFFIGAVRVDGYTPPTWPSNERPQQIHLDLAVDDLDAGEQEAVRLGATRIAEQPSPERSRVLRDPAGHPFCIRA